MWYEVMNSSSLTNKTANAKTSLVVEFPSKTMVSCLALHANIYVWVKWRRIVTDGLSSDPKLHVKLNVVWSDEFLLSH